MKLNKQVVAIAATSSLLGGAITVPTAIAEEDTGEVMAVTAATAEEVSAPVDGFSWPALQITAGGTGEIKPTKTPSDSETYRFTGPADGYGYTFSTDHKTGVIKVQAPADAQPGSSLTMTIGVYKLNDKKTRYEEVGKYKTSIEIVEGGNNNANTYDVSYAPLTVKEGQSAVANNQAKTLPVGTTFEITHRPDRYSVSVDQNGNVTVTPDSKLGAGSTATVRVKVTYPDKSYEFADVEITVADKDGNTTPANERDNAKYNPTWPQVTDANGAAGSTTTANRSGDVPAGTTFKLREDLLGNLRDFFDITVAQDNGNVTVSPKRPLKAGQQFQIAVEATYPDKSTSTKTVTFRIGTDGKWQSQQASVSYPEIVTPGDKEGVSTPKRENVPEGTKFALSTALPEDWSTSVDENTGEVRVKAPANSGAGVSASFYVTATFPDGSKKSYQVHFRTTEPSSKQADAHTVTYPDTVLTAGGSVTATPSVNPAAPAGTVFTGPNQTKDGLTIATDSKTGVVTFSAGAGFSGATATIPVIVRFPDGTTKRTDFKLTVNPAKGPSTTPKPETPKPETPKPETPKPETPKPETPKPETPKPETPKPETPKPETPKPETPKPETPKPETPTDTDKPTETDKPDNNLGTIVGILAAVAVAIGGAIAALPMLQEALKNFKF